MDVANAALPAYVTVLLFFVGLLLRNQDQPVYWRWFSYLDFLKYAWGAQMINQFEDSKAIVFDFQTVSTRCCSRLMICGGPRRCTAHRNGQCRAKKCCDCSSGDFCQNSPCMAAAMGHAIKVSACCAVLLHACAWCVVVPCTLPASTCLSCASSGD
jgi:hypothetical protein